MHIALIFLSYSLAKILIKATLYTSYYFLIFYLKFSMGFILFINSFIWFIFQNNYNFRVKVKNYNHLGIFNCCVIFKGIVKFC